MKRADEIVNLWLSLQAKIEAQNGIASCGQSLYEATACGVDTECESDRLDPVSRRAHNMRKYHITADEDQAGIMISRLPLRHRSILTEPPQLKRKEHPITGRRFTAPEIAEYFGLTLNGYYHARKVARTELIEIDKRFNSYLYKRSA